MVLYKDHNKIETAVNAFSFAKDNLSEYVSRFLDFSEPTEAAKFIEEAKIGGGGDFAEAAIDGLNDAVN